MAHSAKKPVLIDYLNIHDFLRDLYSYRKTTESNFSYESWSQELGLSNRSFLRQIIIGRRAITDATSQIICDRLNLGPNDREYFQLLVLYSKARTVEQRNLYGRKMRQLVRSEHPQNEVVDFQEFVSDILIPRLQMLLSFTDIDKSVENLARILKKDPKVVEAALQSLESIQMAKKVNQPDGSVWWETSRKDLKVPSAVGNKALLKYHEQCLNEAIGAQNLPIDQRRYRSLIIALTVEDFEKFQQELDIFVKQTLSQYNATELDQKKLFQINFNLHSFS